MSATSRHANFLASCLTADIRAEGVTLDLEAELTSLAGYTEAASDRFPIISSSSLNTRVTVPGDGKHWLKLGGLRSGDTPDKQIAILVSAETVPPTAPAPRPVTEIAPPAH